MKAIFSNEFTTADEVTAQDVDALGPMLSEWWDFWDTRARFFDEIKRHLNDSEAWAPLDEAFEEFIQKYRRKQTNFGMFVEDET